MTLANIGSERAVLAGICQYGLDGFIDASDIISIETFTSETNQLIYKCLQHVFNNDTKKIDIASILSAATSLSLEEILKETNNHEYIRSLFNFPIHLENISQHAKILAKLEIARLAQRKHKEAHGNLQNVTGNETIDEIICMSEKPVFDLALELNQGKEQEPSLMSQDGRERLEELFSNPVEMIGIPTPFGYFNESIGGGLRPGVTLVAARPKIGKSTFSKECAIHIAKQNIPVLILDTEMSKDDIHNKCLAGLSNVYVSQIETGKVSKYPELVRKVWEAQTTLEKLPLYHKRISGKEFDEVLSIIRRWIYKHVGFDESGKANPHVVCYDYFKLMSSKDLGKLQEYQAVGFQVSSLCDFCSEYDTKTLAFVQINRDGLTKETSDIISQSDRLLWLCNALAIFKRKSQEEIAEDGVKNGSHKLITLECRYGKPMSVDSDYINVEMDGDISTIKEVSTKKRPIKSESDSEFIDNKGEEPF